MVGLTLILGLIGLAVHIAWIVAIVVLGILFGLMAAELRGRRTGGVISEVVAAVVAEAKEVPDGVTNSDPTGAANTSAPDPAT